MIIGVQKFSIFFYGYEADRPVFWAGRADGWQLNLQVCLTIVAETRIPFHPTLAVP